MAALPTTTSCSTRRHDGGVTRKLAYLQRSSGHASSLMPLNETISIMETMDTVQAQARQEA
jgi:hypothetical protein